MFLYTSLIIAPIFSSHFLLLLQFVDIPLLVQVIIIVHFPLMHLHLFVLGLPILLSDDLLLLDFLVFQPHLAPGCARLLLFNGLLNRETSVGLGIQISEGLE